MTNAVAQLEAYPGVDGVAATALGQIEREFYSPELQQHRFTELHRRAWNSQATIEQYAAEGKTHAEAHERRFLEDYRYEIAGLARLARRDERTLITPDPAAPSPKQARQMALSGKDAPEPVEVSVLSDGRIKTSYIIEVSNASLGH